MEQCRISGELETNPITNESLQKAVKTSSGAIRTLIWELKADSFIGSKALKKGRVGLRKFVLPRRVHQQLLMKSTVSQPSVNRQLTVSQPSATVSQPSVNRQLNRQLRPLVVVVYIILIILLLLQGGFPKLGSKLKYRKASKIWVLELPISNKFRNLAMYQLKKFKGASTTLLMT